MTATDNALWDHIHAERRRLVMVAAGRSAYLGELEGDGVATLRGRLA